MIVDIYATRAEWLAGRRDPTAIGASEAAACLGVHSYLDAWTLWDRKINGTASDDTSAVLGRGQRWEQVVIAEYGEASGNRVVEPGAYFGKPGHLVTLANEAFPWLRSSPDAFAWQGDVLGHVEAKTSMFRDHWSPDGGIVIDAWDDAAASLVPPGYAIQAYVQLAVTEMPWNDVCALVPSGGWLEVRWVRIMRDIETQSQIVEALAEWRERHLVAKEPPPIDGSQSCNHWLARAFQKRAERPASVEERVAIERLASLRADGKKITEEVKKLTNTLVLGCEGSRLTFGGKGSPYAQPQYNGGKTTVDVKVLKEKFPEAHAACSRKGASFVIFKTYGFSGGDDDE